MQSFGKQLRRSGEFKDEARELDFRGQQRNAERRQLRVLWLWALFFFFLYGVSEYFSDSPAYLGSWSFIPRLVILLTGMTVLALEGGIRHPRKRDVLACGALIIVGICYALLLAGRSGADNPLGAVILLVCGIYLFSPGRYALVCGCGVFCSLATALALSLPSTEGPRPWLAISYLVPTNLLAAMALAQFNRLRRLEYLQREQLQQEMRAREKISQALRRADQRNRELLYNALPSDIARQLGENPGEPIARYHASATVMFIDLVDFSTLSRNCEAAELVSFLDQLFCGFDSLARSHRVEKIKTLGDAWMGVAGLGGDDTAETPLRSVLGLAQALQAVAGRCPAPGRSQIQLRIGVHSGPLVAGVIGRQRYAFDVWGETVNVASRLQGAAQPGHILVSAPGVALAPGGYRFGPSCKYALKGCGVVDASVFQGEESLAGARGSLPAS